MTTTSLPKSLGVLDLLRNYIHDDEKKWLGQVAECINAIHGERYYAAEDCAKLFREILRSHPGLFLAKCLREAVEECEGEIYK